MPYFDYTLVVNEPLISDQMYAPGIKSKTHIPSITAVKSPKAWDYVIQHHKAKKAGSHYDLRLWDGKYGHSWALRELPKPGEQKLAVRQPNHERSYFSFSGEIPHGYGAGSVSIHEQGTADVVEANDKFVRFQTHNGAITHEYALIHTGENNWICVNKKPLIPEKHGLSLGKQKFKSKERGQIDLKDKSSILTAKIDGGATSVVMLPHKFPVLFSPRKSKRTGGYLEYTHKVPGAYYKRSDPKDGLTHLRGEVFVDAPRPAPARIIGGILNAHTLNSRELQKRHGKLKVALYDVEKHRGKDISTLPYSEKLPILQKFVKKYPKLFTLPANASTPAAKAKLIRQIASGKHPQTEEGVVEWNHKPTKIKFHRIDDVFVKRIAPGAGKYTKAGGALEYSLTKDGPIVGNVGTGFSDDERKEMTTHPSKWVGKKVVVKHMGKMPSGALRNPSFQGFHVE